MEVLSKSESYYKHYKYKSIKPQVLWSNKHALFDQVVAVIAEALWHEDAGAASYGYPRRLGPQVNDRNWMHPRLARRLKLASVQVHRIAGAVSLAPKRRAEVITVTVNALVSRSVVPEIDQGLAGEKWPISLARSECKIAPS